MRFFIFSLIMIFYFTNSFCQGIEEKKKSIDSLITFVKNKVPSKANEIAGKKISLSDLEMEKAKKYFYETFAYASIEFQKELTQWVNEWGNEIKNSSYDKSILSPGIKLSKIKNAIADKYGWDYVHLLETPYFLKVRILDIKPGSYKSYDDSIHTFPVVNITAEVLEAVKGEEFYETGDIIIFSYFPFWYSECNCPVKFEVNSVYAIPFRPWDYRDNKAKNELLIKNNGMDHFYKIENGIVTKPFTNDRSSNREWKVFRSEFKNKYNVN